MKQILLISRQPHFATGDSEAFVEGTTLLGEAMYQGEERGYEGGEHGYEGGECGERTDSPHTVMHRRL